ncbi:hypothetical protein FKR81_02305 [Lentzea tibetensis]|uniref:KAP NTPase domain-containing protein n=1 Tax=Lentzea tibetensis TaxID=2591470 RepID=A0A563F0Z0_9PSEU|nr:hypothetical protein [Lentzea tibetensis]TWP53620.1 hypothetical protein FKR81_02305 [Lentzea tibetensis]
MPTRREALFTELLDQAVDSDEVKRGLSETSAVTADELRERCLSQQSRMWDELGFRATEFDEAAQRWERLERLHRPGRFLRWWLTSSRAQVTLALLGLMAIAYGFWRSVPSSAGFRPHEGGLLFAMLLMCAAILSVLLSKDFLGIFPKHRIWIPRLIVKLDPALLTGLSIVVFFFAITRVMNEDALRLLGGFDRAGLLGPTCLLMGVLFGAPFIVDAFRRPARRGRWGSLFALEVVLFCAPVLFLLADGTGALAIDIAQPDLLSVFGGEGLIVVAALAATTGGRIPTAQRVEEAHVVSRGAVATKLTESHIMPFLRVDLSRHNEDYGVQIDIRDAPGVSQVFDALYRVPTAAAREVAALLNGMPGGSIGLAGARGSGKTTLMESYCTGQRGDDTLSTMVAAPVEYSAREFLLHLYAKVCQEILGAEHDPVRHMHRLTIARQSRQGVVAVMVGLLSTVVGAALVTFPELQQVSSAQLWGVLLIVTGGGVILSFLGLTNSLRRSVAAPRTLEERAAERLEEIRYQQSFTATLTGTTKLSVGIEGALSRARGLTRQPMNLPEIVDSLRTFLAEASTVRKRVIVGIDELDKMKSETAAEQFLNEIKGVFGIRGCYFLVSVSEEAMSTFERRGLPFRDVFDSTFDEIVWFEHLTTAEAITTIDRRVLMPIPFKQLCFTLSGGLPRDLIRVVRTMLDRQDEHSTGLSVVAQRLVADDVRRKTRAVAVAARRIQDGVNVGRFLVLCDRVKDVRIDSSALRRLVTEAVPDEVDDTTKLIGELVCFFYYSATVLDFFHVQPDEQRWREAGSDNGRGLAELARARQAFSASTLVAWEGVSKFRRSWYMDEIPYPAGLLATAGSV